MTTDDLNKMTAMAAMHVRNALEEFHATGGEHEVEGLTDPVMAELNKAVRRAIYEFLYLMAVPDTTTLGDTTVTAGQALGFLQMSVPSYWEPASELPGEFDLPPIV